MKALGHGELIVSEHGLAAVPCEVSTVAIGLGMVKASSGAMPTKADAE